MFVQLHQWSHTAARSFPWWEAPVGHLWRSHWENQEANRDGVKLRQRIGSFLNRIYVNQDDILAIIIGFARNIPTQNSLYCIVLNEFDVGQSDISSRGLYKWVSFIFLLNHHFIRKPKPWRIQKWQVGKTQKEHHRIISLFIKSLMSNLTA